jgi:hypothetical protein
VARSSGGGREFDRQSIGIHLSVGEDRRKPVPPSSCPGCGERFLSPRDAAWALRKITSYVHAILASRPELLRAFRGGSCWIVPERGPESYRQASEESARKRNSTPNRKVRIVPIREIIVRQETYHCPTYPFPHYRGGGQCER